MPAPIPPRKPAPGRSLAELFPRVAALWDVRRNGVLSPRDVTLWSRVKVWWRCPQAVDHAWQATPEGTKKMAEGCPFCSGWRASATNNLAVVNPALARLWHQTKNGSLTPDDVLPGSDKIVWWKCPAGSDHEWRARIEKQRRGTCPFCANTRPSITNSLATKHPDIAKLWDPTKNGAVTPRLVLAGATRQAWWRCPKGPDHAWKATVAAVANSRGCPFCGHWRVSVDNCLATVAPEVARHLHPTKNGELTAREISAYTHRRVWWICDKDPRHVWKASVYMRIRNRGRRFVCSMCINRRVSASNCLAARHPKLAAQWDPRRNGALEPSAVSVGHSRHVWWRCPAAPDHRWQASVKNRVASPNCPFCSNRRAAPSGSLARLRPRLARLWHPRKNGELRPTEVVPGAGRRAWWRCPRGVDHEWRARVVDVRDSNGTCPFCVGRRVSVTNSLAALFPDVAGTWHPERNGGVHPSDVLAAARELAWWRCPLGHAWRASVRERTVSAKACPICAAAPLRRSG